MEKRFEESQERAKRIIIELTRLTITGKAKWWRQKQHPQCLYCFVNSEIFVFDTHDEDGHINKQMGGVSLEIRNRSFLWLTDLEGWDDVINLLLQGSRNMIDSEEYGRLIRQCDPKILQDLETTI